MKKFIVSQDRKKIIEAKINIEIVEEPNIKDKFCISVAYEIVGEGYSLLEAKNQLLLIVNFLNRKDTLNDSVYFMPILKDCD